MNSSPIPSSSSSSSSANLTSKKVAVIGAGVAGLVASRELRGEGHEVVVFERNNRVGRIWVYDPNVESDPLGIDPSRSIVHSSLYESLRTNLPREIMGFRDYPFVSLVEEDGIKKQRDPRRYPGHKEVLNYLEDFASDFRLTELIRFETEVVHVELVEEGRWVVKSRSIGEPDHADDVFDAVVVCIGHCTEPNIAEIPGIDSWPGEQIHSHNYRVREPFRDQVVLLIGNAPSAWDISRDIARVAKEVHVASRSFTNETPTKQPGYDNMWLHSMIESAHEDGTVVFQDGSSVYVDLILHCTGYKFYFPFLKTNNIVTVDDNRVGPLYKHVFPPSLAPGLSFISIPWRVIPFLISELQSKWVAGVLSGRISLPSQEKMTADVEAFYLKLEAAGVPKRYTHNLMDSRAEYIDWLAAECGSLPWEEWRKQMELESFKRTLSQPETYRDEWEDEHLILQAQEEFRKYLPAVELREYAKGT